MDKIPLKYNGNGCPRALEREDIKIVKAAIRQGEFVYTGWRHAAILMDMKDAGCSSPSYDDQGFVDQEGHFYRRSPAGTIVRMNEQVKEFINPSVLTSEDLWDNEGNQINA